MYILEVSPIKRIKGFKTLSYFSSYKFKRGDIVTAPFKNSEILVLVHSVHSVKSIKAEIKDENFAPKKIKKQEPLKITSKKFIQAVFDMADFYMLPAGVLLNELVPSALFKYHELIKNCAQNNSAKKEKDDLKIKTFTLNAFEDERMQEYRSAVRRELALGNDIFIVTGNMQNAERIFKHIKPGIENMVEIFDSGASPKKQALRIAELNGKKSGFCLVGTSAILSLCKYPSYIIVDKSNSDSYVKTNIQNFPLPNFIKKYAAKIDSEIMLADTFTGLETFKELQEEKIGEILKTPKRIRKSVRIRQIDLNKEIQYNKEFKLNYPILSKEIIGQLSARAPAGEKCLVLSWRKGLASQVICNDCGNVLHCPKCNSLLKLEKLNDTSRHLLCHRCGFTLKSNINCPKCGSWNLKDLGVGIDKVEGYLKEKVPFAKILKFDSTTVKSEKNALKILEDFFTNDGEARILLATPKVLDYLTQDSINYTALINPDSLLSVPVFDIEENIFYKLIKTLEKSSEIMDLQIKDFNSNAINSFASKEFMRYIKQELDLRKKLMWPPYVTIIKVSVTGSKESVIENMREFLDVFSEYKPRFFKEFIYVDEKSVKLSALLRIPDTYWPNKTNDLRRKLSLLNNSFSVEINPKKPL